MISLLFSWKLMFIGSGFGLCVIPTEWRHSGYFDENISGFARFEFPNCKLQFATIAKIKRSQ